MTEMNRREFLKRASASVAAAPIAACVAHPIPVGSPSASAIPDRDTGTIVNDVHSQLNATRVAEIVKPHDVEALQAAVRRASAAGQSVSVAGGATRWADSSLAKPAC